MIGSKELRILILGLDNAGKTTILCIQKIIVIIILILFDYLINLISSRLLTLEDLNFSFKLIHSS